MYFNRHSRGFGIIEILLASSIVSGMLIAFASVFILANRLVGDTSEKIRANYIAEESLEVMRFKRDAGWNANIAALNAGTEYFLDFDPGSSSWAVTTVDPGLVDGIFKRVVSVANVMRDSNDDIVTQDGADDPDSRKIIAKVSWGEGEESSVEYIGGITDIDLANFPSNNSGDGDAAQSFTTPAAESVAVPSVELFIKKATADPSDIFLEIRSDSSVGTVLGTSATIDAASLASSLGWQKFSFSPSVQLDANTQYFLRLKSNPDSTVAFSGSAGTIHWGYLQSASSPYAGGQARRYVGRLSDPSDQGQLLDQYDFGFRVFKESAVGNSVQVETYLSDIFNN